MQPEKSVGECPGGVRKVTARWVITALMTLKTAAHFGGRGESAVDMTVLRDPKEGTPLLPGTSLAGALRGYLADRMGGYGSKEDAWVQRLFGFSRVVDKDGQNVDEGDQSPLIVFDSFGTFPSGEAVELRDGVAIESDTGIAAEGKKFDMEVLPPGTVFPIRLELVVTDPVREVDLVAHLSASLSGLASGDIALGARRSRGLGAVETGHWHAVRYDLTNARGWMTWLLSDAETKHLIQRAESQFDTPIDAIMAADPGRSLQEIADLRRRMTISADLRFTSGLLVRSPGNSTDAPDAVHLTSGGGSVLPGTSLAGVLRHRALRIARWVRKDRGDADDWADAVFGPPPKAQGEGGLAASRFRVSESRIRGGKRVRPTRIRIDRFTQGVYKGALFDEELDHGGQTRVRMELRIKTDAENGEAECGWILLLLKDLLSGSFPVGGSGAVGRGRVEATARVCFPDGRHIDVGPNLAVSETDRPLLNERITAFHRAKTLEAERKGAVHD